MASEPLPECEFQSGDLLVKVDLTLPADVNAITPVVQKIMAIIGEMGCAAGREFEIELSMREALANAIEHGSGNDPSKQVQCCVACDKARGMLIIVRDPGPGFPILGQNLYSTGGRGIYLNNHLLDDVRFERGGTEIHMRKNPPAV